MLRKPSQHSLPVHQQHPNSTAAFLAPRTSTYIATLTHHHLERHNHHQHQQQHTNGAERNNNSRQSSQHQRRRRVEEEDDEDAEVEEENLQRDSEPIVIEEEVDIIPTPRTADASSITNRTNTTNHKQAYPHQQPQRTPSIAGSVKSASSSAVVPSRLTQPKFFYKTTLPQHTAASADSATATVTAASTSVVSSSPSVVAAAQPPHRSNSRTSMQSAPVFSNPPSSSSLIAPAATPALTADEEMNKLDARLRFLRAAASSSASTYQQSKHPVPATTTNTTAAALPLGSASVKSEITPYRPVVRKRSAPPPSTQAEQQQQHPPITPIAFLQQTGTTASSSAAAPVVRPSRRVSSGASSAQKQQDTTRTVASAWSDIGPTTRKPFVSSQVNVPVAVSTKVAPTTAKQEVRHTRSSVSSSAPSATVTPISHLPTSTATAVPSPSIHTQTNSPLPPPTNSYAAVAARKPVSIKKKKIPVLSALEITQKWNIGGGGKGLEANAEQDEKQQHNISQPHAEIITPVAEILVKSRPKLKSKKKKKKVQILSTTTALPSPPMPPAVVSMPLMKGEEHGRVIVSDPTLFADDSSTSIVHPSSFIPTTTNNMNGNNQQAKFIPVRRAHAAPFSSELDIDEEIEEEIEAELREVGQKMSNEKNGAGGSVYPIYQQYHQQQPQQPFIHPQSVQQQPSLDFFHPPPPVPMNPHFLDVTNMRPSNSSVTTASPISPRHQQQPHHPIHAQYTRPTIIVGVPPLQPPMDPLLQMKSKHHFSSTLEQSYDTLNEVSLLASLDRLDARLHAVTSVPVQAQQKPQQKTISVKRLQPQTVQVQ